ncbi:MAG: YaiO family outer membrane beta-barrel protein [Burkholderiaceae bacterium]
MMPWSRLCALVGVALVLCGATLPASAQPEVERLYNEGVKARLAGHPETAIPIFSQALAIEPNNADLLLQQGLAMSAVGRDDEARRLFEAVLRIAPNYTDASEALERLRARQAHARAVAAGELEPGEPRFRLDAGGSHSTLSGDRPSWKEGSFRLAYKASSRTTVSGGVDVSRRFDNTDTYGELRVDHRISDRLDGHLYAGGTPNAHFLPKTAMGLGGQYRLNATAGTGSTYGLLNLRYARYLTGEVWSAHAGLIQYLNQDKIWLTATSINTLDENKRYLGGYMLRVDWQVQPKLRLLAGYANAPESDNGITVRTRSVFGGAVYDFSPVFGVNLTASREQREGLFDRDTIGVGLTYRF